MNEIIASKEKHVDSFYESLKGKNLLWQRDTGVRPENFCLFTSAKVQVYSSLNQRTTISEHVIILSENSGTCSIYCSSIQSQSTLHILGYLALF